VALHPLPQKANLCVREALNFIELSLERPDGKKTGSQLKDIRRAQTREVHACWSCWAGASSSSCPLPFSFLGCMSAWYWWTPKPTEPIRGINGINGMERLTRRVSMFL